MNRRQFLLTSGAVLAGVTAGTAVWLHGVKVPSLAETRARLGV